MLSPAAFPQWPSADLFGALVHKSPVFPILFGIHSAEQHAAFSHAALYAKGIPFIAPCVILFSEVSLPIPKKQPTRRPKKTPVSAQPVVPPSDQALGGGEPPSLDRAKLGGLPVEPPDSSGGLSSTPSKPPIPAEEALRLVEKREGSGRGHVTMRAHMAKIIALRVLGRSVTQIGEELGLKPQTVSNYMHLAGKKGFLKQTAPQERMEFEVPHKAVRNLVELLDTPDPRTNRPDKEVTLATLSGIGYFKTHTAVKNENAAPTMAFQLNVVNVGPEAPVSDDSMGGTPGFVDGEVE